MPVKFAFSPPKSEGERRARDGAEIVEENTKRREPSSLAAAASAGAAAGAACSSCCTMKRAYPVVKFVPPRSTSGNKPAVSAADDRCTPPLREKATVSPALTKRKRPTTQSWKEPRRRLDPPSPSKTHTASAARTARAAPPPAKTSRHGSRHENSNGPSLSPAYGQHVSNPTAERQGKHPRVAPVVRRYSSTKALVLAAETPAKNRGHPSTSRRRMTSVDGQEMDVAGRLRIPDTPEPTEEPKVVEERRATHSERTRAENDNDNSSSSNSSSFLSPPPLGHCWEAEEGVHTAGAAGSGTPGPACAAAAASPEKPICSADSESESGSDSPDLLRSYAMGTKSKTQEPTCTRATGQGGSGSSGGGTGGSVAKVQTACSEESDTGSDSPDLLRAYPVVDCLPEEPQRAAGKAPSRQSLHQAAVAPSTRPDRENPQSLSCRLDAAKPDTDASKRPVSVCHKAIPCAQAGGGAVSIDKRRGITADTDTIPEDGRGGAEVQPPARKGACGVAGAGAGDSSAAARPRFSPEREVTEARRRDRDREGRGGAAGSHGIPVVEVQPPAVGSVSGAGGARGNSDAPQTGSARSRPPVFRNASSPASKNGGCTVTGLAGVDHVTTSATRLQPAPLPSAIDARLSPAGANGDRPKITVAGCAPKDPGCGSPVSRNTSPDASKDGGLASANSPHPHAATGGRAPAVVHNPYSTTAGRLPASVVVNPYSAAGAAAAGGPAASFPVRQAARCSSPAGGEDPKAQVEPSQTQSSSGRSSATPPEVRFETARQQLYKNPRSGAAGGWRGRGRGRGGGRGAGRGGKRGSTAPRPAQDALVGVWRTKPPRKKGERGSR